MHLSVQKKFKKEVCIHTSIYILMANNLPSLYNLLVLSIILRNLSSVIIFLHPQKFCQICCMQSLVNSICGHGHFSMPPITFNTVYACSCFWIEKVFTVIDSNMVISHFIQLIVCFPAITMYYGSLCNPLCYDW